MSSKSRGGLSKREYAAKTAKLSAPKSTYKAPSSSREVVLGDFSTTSSHAQQEQDRQYQQAYAKSQGWTSDNDPYKDSGDWQKGDSGSSNKSSSNKSSSKPKTVSVPTPSNQRYQASIVANAPKGLLSGIGNVAGQLWNEGKGLIAQGGVMQNPYSTIGKLVEDIQTGFNTPGGIFGSDVNNNQGLQSPLLPGVDINEQGRVAGAESNQPYNEPEYAGGGNDFANQFYQKTGNNPSQRQNPQPTKPFQPTGGLSSVYTPMAQQMGFGQENVPSYTQPENGTVQRPVGMGQFSSGQYANGAGNYGLGGGFSGGNPMDNEQNLINKILGINTAQASEQPSISEMNQQQSNIIPDNLLTPAGIKVWGSQSPGAMTENGYQESEPSFDTQMAQSENEYSDLQNQEQGLLAQLMKLGGLGETAQASGQVLGASAPTRGTLSQREYAAKNGQEYDSGSDYNRIYDKQEKSQKKANDEYLKSIDRQYAEAQTSGTADLEKSKQQDLLKLGAQFNFGNADPNDEQRIQYQGRTNNDYAGQVVDMIKKLASAKAGDVSTAQQNLQKVLSDIQNSRIAQQQKVAEIQRSQQQQQFDNAYKIYGLKNKTTSSGSSSPYPVQKGEGQDGSPRYVDGNKNSPTYGQEIYWQG